MIARPLNNAKVPDGTLTVVLVLVADQVPVGPSGLPSDDSRPNPRPSQRPA